MRVAVDDFGTGTSSLAELRDLPVDVLKLGKPFVDALETRPGEREFVRVIVELGRVLGLTVAAEGVETEGQLALLRELGVDVAQGNLMAAAQVGGRRSSSTCGAARERRGLARERSGHGVLGPEPPSGGVRRPPLADPPTSTQLPPPPLGVSRSACTRGPSRPRAASGGRPWP